MTGRGRGDRFLTDVAVVGGCGHVGLPLAIALADRGASVTIFDISEQAVAAVGSGRMPFAEPGADQPLGRALAAGRLAASSDPQVVATAEHVIVAIAAPAGGPDLGPGSIAAALDTCAGWLRDGQLLVLRSTVAPGTTASAEKLVARLGIDADVAFCPERVAEGHAMTELFSLPQIVSSRTASGLERAGALFSLLTPALVAMSPEEAELAKLFANAWRYLQFAAANQFYMIASELGQDYERIRQGLATGYPRAAGLARAGFAAGPCLLKDTAALAAASGAFELGAAAIAVNQGLPEYLVSRLERRFGLAEMTVGILGMAFKGGSDDPRSSLAYRLRDIMRGRARRVLCTDPLVAGDPELRPLAEVIEASDLLVIAAPQPQYRELRTDKPVADIWNVLGGGVLA